MKAVLTNKIFLEVDNDLKTVIQKELTYELPSEVPTVPPIHYTAYSKVNDRVYSIPFARTDLIPEGYEVINKRLVIPAEWPDYVMDITFRESQQQILDKAEGSFFLNAPPSWGKTFMALAIAKKYGLKTLVITHTTLLRDQWIEECQKLFGFTPGVIGGGRFEVHPILTIGNVQTLSKRLKDIGDKFSLIIYDEAHHSVADGSLKIMTCFQGMYRIGLSGTMIRRDGRDILLKNIFGTTVFQPEAENRATPRVIMVRLPVSLKDAGLKDRPTALANNELFQQAVIGATKYAVDLGHTALVVSDRVHLLETLYAKLDLNCEIVASDWNKDSLERKLVHDKALDKKIDVLLGTISIYSEGVSINSLSCLILGCQIGKNDARMDQIINRITRLREGKLQPVIIDFKLSDPMSTSQANYREGFYLKHGYDITYINGNVL